jgi:hypothetical protein
MDATLHLMIEQLRELKSAVNAGHLELKKEMQQRCTIPLLQQC